MVLLAAAGASLSAACSSTTDPPIEPAPAASVTPTSPTGTSPPDAAPPPEACGASQAKRCPAGAPCQGPTDCVSLNCQAGTCREAACDNGVQDGSETGADCGGSCAKKCDGEPCKTGTDCLSTTCAPDGTCAPAGTKTCGVGLPVACKDGDPCVQDKDCASDYCRALACGPAPATVHQDGRRNGGETGIDCGGTAAPAKLCPSGEKCVTSDDCLSTCTNLRCDAPGPTDGKKNNGETDVDCGGPSAPKCATGKACVAGTDCGLGYCSGNACVVPTGTDGVKNGGETDIDCGGTGVTFGGTVVPPAPRCDPKKTCVVDGDCDSSACATNKICVEGPSCRPIHGGQTCGTGEFGRAGANHESCCRTLPVPGLTMVHQGVTKQVYVDKYEITAGRIRAWVEAITAQYGGVPNIKAWVTARAAADPLVATQLTAASIDYLPSQFNNEPKTFPAGTVDMGLDSQLGPTSYYRGFSTGGTSGCYLGAGGYGHRTYYFDAGKSAVFGEVARAASMKDVLDEKSMNCMTPIMFAAFCAWDGGYMLTPDAMAGAYGPSQWPWGDTPTPQDNVALITNYNNGRASTPPRRRAISSPWSTTRPSPTISRRSSRPRVASPTTSRK